MNIIIISIVYYYKRTLVNFVIYLLYTCLIVYNIAYIYVLYIYDLFIILIYVLIYNMINNN